MILQFVLRSRFWENPIGEIGYFIFKLFLFAIATGIVFALLSPLFSKISSKKRDAMIERFLATNGLDEVMALVNDISMIKPGYLLSLEFKDYSSKEHALGFQLDFDDDKIDLIHERVEDLVRMDQQHYQMFPDTYAFDGYPDEEALRNKNTLVCLFTGTYKCLSPYFKKFWWYLGFEDPYNYKPPNTIQGKLKVGSSEYIDTGVLHRAIEQKVKQEYPSANVYRDERWDNRRGVTVYSLSISFPS